MSVAKYFAYRRLVINLQQAGTTILPYNKFTQPFNTGAWIVSQNGVGWYYDGNLQLALNDGTYNDTQFLHQGYPTAPAADAYEIVIVVVDHPSGLLNFGTVNIIFTNYYLAFNATPGRVVFQVPNVPENDHFFLYATSGVRIAIKSVDVTPV